MIYPSERDIIEYFANLPQAVTDEFAELLERGQRDYRRAWQLERLNEDKRIDVLSRFAADVFKTRVAKILRERAGNFEGFRAAISIDGGEAELAFWYAHRLYNLVERGRMLAIWHHKIAPRLGDRIREAENLWYTPDLVPDGWEPFLADTVRQSTSPGDPVASDVVPKPEAARKAPADFFDGYRAKNPTMSYDKIASRIGISRDSLFKIKEETDWVREYAYDAAAGVLGCRPEDLHPRNLPKRPRRKRSSPDGVPEPSPQT